MFFRAKRRRHLVLLTLLLSAWLGGCTDKPEPVQPLHIDAVYQLLFNESLVGNALFALSINADGTYRIEAFTTPAGQMATPGGHEVLEVSAGELDMTQIRPASFEHSVMQGDTFERVNLEFDWAGKKLRIENGDVQQTLGLLPDTHDRLSYLLAAGRLVNLQKDAISPIRLAALDATEEAVLQVIGDSAITVPYGDYTATGIRRVTIDDHDQRELWFSNEVGPLPLKVLRRADGNSIEMQLVSLTPAAAQPVSE
jgi:hypothetical protein